MTNTPGLNGSGPVRLTRDDAVALVELCDPKRRNAMSDDIKSGLAAAVDYIANTPDIRAVTITGSDGVFCAGGDLKAMFVEHQAGNLKGAEDVRPRMQSLHSWMRKLRDLPVPVIAAVNGPAYGAGLGLALTADIILASSRATFNASFCKLGAVPDGNLFYSLPRMVGLQRAKEMFYTGRTVKAEEAQRIGIAMEVLPPKDLLPRAREMARMMCDASPTAFAMTKSISNRSMELDSEALLMLEAQAQSICLTSDYMRDALDRFTRKEPPKFAFD